MIARMEIANPCVVSLTWKLSDAQNRPLDELAEPVEFFYGGDDLLAKVEEALAGHVTGDELHLQLEPADAFGDYRPELVCFEERKLFAEPVEAGMAYEGLPRATRRRACRPTRCTSSPRCTPRVVLDANTRWRAWRCACTPGARRAQATEEELKRAASAKRR
ncbi:MAG: peptidylprolyl isomerase [Rubrivivax sp.]